MFSGEGAWHSAPGAVAPPKSIRGSDKLYPSMPIMPNDPKREIENKNTRLSYKHIL